MKPMRIAALGLAAIALSGLFASAAVAEESGDPGSQKAQLVACDDVAGTNDVAQECARPFVGTYAEVQAVSDRVQQCFESHLGLHGTGKPFAEMCLENAVSGSSARIAKLSKRAHRVKLRQRKHAHPH